MEEKKNNKNKIPRQKLLDEEESHVRQTLPLR